MNTTWNETGDHDDKLSQYIQAHDVRAARAPNKARLDRMIRALAPLLDATATLGPWSDTIPTGCCEARRQ